jgi:dipeptidyl aminopeptidase/acylaminoacyl peptidase
MKQFFLILITMSIAFYVQAQKTWTPEQMIKFKRLAEAVISPDGKLIAYSISTPVMEGEKSEFLAHIWVTATDGSFNQQFTFGEKSCTNPQFSPDGKWLSFTSARGEDKKNQLYLMSLKGGEAERITSQKNGISSYDWSPDGSQIAFTMQDAVSEKDEKDIKEKRDMVVADDFKNYHIYTIALAKDNKGDRKVKQVTKGNFSVASYSWAPDSKTIAFGHQPNSSLDVWTFSDISTVSLENGKITPLAAGKGAESTPMYSPDGKLIAFISDEGSPTWARRTDIYVIPATGGQAVKLAPTFDQRQNLLGWTSDSKSIYYSEPYKTNQVVYSIGLDGKPSKMITQADGVYSFASFSRAGDKMAYVYQNASTPPNVFVNTFKSKKIDKLTNLNDDFAGLKTARTEIISWKSKDGKFDIEGLITYPEKYQGGKKYPLMLNIHGGPAGVFSQNYTGASSPYPLQAFASEGYAVLRVNPRGSSGYGADFRHANISDWGYSDYDDIMGGVDKLINDGVVHPDSLVVSGWSYGGYMTSMIVTKTDRFKAAMVGAGVTNLISFVGTADIPSFIPDYFEGEIWDRTDVYIKHSAMFSIKNVKTPTLVIHGENDDRVPISQGQEMYRALKRLGVKTEMVSYPRTPHGPREPKFIQDIGERLIYWFNENCRGSKPFIAGTEE